MGNNYKIKKIMNNNVLLAQDLSSKKEAVLVGKGLDFGRKVNAIVSISKETIEKIFVTYDESLKNDYFKLIDSIDESVIETCSDVILKAEETLGELNSRVHVVLTDHISFALERLEMGLDIENPFINVMSMGLKKDDEILVEVTGENQSDVEEKLLILINSIND